MISFIRYDKKKDDKEQRRETVALWYRNVERDSTKLVIM